MAWTKIGSITVGPFDSEVEIGPIIAEAQKGVEVRIVQTSPPSCWNFGYGLLWAENSEGRFLGTIKVYGRPEGETYRLGAGLSSSVGSGVLKFSPRAYNLRWIEASNETWSLDFYTTEGLAPTPQEVTVEWMLIGSGATGKDKNWSGGGGAGASETGTYTTELNAVHNVTIGQNTTEGGSFGDSSFSVVDSKRVAISFLAQGGQAISGSPSGSSAGADGWKSGSNAGPAGQGRTADSPSGSRTNPGGNGGSVRIEDLNKCVQYGGLWCNATETSAGGGGGGGETGGGSANKQTPGVGGDGFTSAFTGVNVVYCGGQGGMGPDGRAAPGAGADQIGGALYPNGALLYRIPSNIQLDILSGSLVQTLSMDGNTRVVVIQGTSGTFRFVEANR